MTRIIAGSARGRRLQVPAGDGVRPTSDRVREALFSALESARGPLSGARVLDLYAGSGALGLEAASRGAAHVLLVESDRRVVAVVRENVGRVGRAGAVEVRASPVRQVLATPPGTPYDVVLVDPPYPLTTADVTGVLTDLATGWLAEHAMVVVERSSRSEPLRWPAGLVGTATRRYGDTTLWYGRRAATQEGM